MINFIESNGNNLVAPRNKKTTMKHFFLAVGFFCMALTSLQAQYYLTGEDPASVKWNQLRTTYFRVIYPQANKEQAWELAMLLDTIYQASNFDLSSKTVRTDLILHSHSVISNALVGWQCTSFAMFLKLTA
jgi:hypothetical protein